MTTKQGEVRKSDRAKKATTFFTVPSRTKPVEEKDDDGGFESNEDSENLENNQIDTKESDDGNDDDMDLGKNRKQGRKRKSLTSTTPRTNSHSKTKKSIDGNENIPENIAKMSLFDALRKLDEINPKKIESSRPIENAIKSLVNRWLNEFRRDRIPAIVDIVNFVLLCSGASKEWIERDVDLDALEPEELDELLVDMIKEMTRASETSVESGASYPLVESTKKGKSSKSTFRNLYTLFWEQFAVHLLNDMYTASSNEVKQVQRGRGSAVDILNVMIDQLVAFSSMPIVNIRDAVTEALGSIGHRVVISNREVREQLNIVSRQVDIENKKSGKQIGKQQSIVKQHDYYTKVGADLAKLSELIFNSIFVHRFKDSHDSVRAVCLSKLTDWILEDPSQYYNDEYLKYICWMSFDLSAQVRKEALVSFSRIIDNEKVDVNASDRLRLVVERFTERFIEIAAGDVSDDVALEMFMLMRKFQAKGYLDHVGDEMDLVDQIVFDPTASPRTRQEALLFLMDHTEGFEVLDDEPDTSGKDNKLKSSQPSKKKSKKDSSSREETDESAVRKRHAFQLETLAEFAEYHLLKDMTHEDDISAKLTKVDMLAEACLMVTNFKALYDWPVITTLLMKESDGVITTTLRDPLIAILLRLFVRCVTYLHSHVVKASQAPINQSSNVSVISTSKLMHTMEETMMSLISGSQRPGGTKKSSSNILTSPPKELSAIWEGFIEHLLVIMPKLFLRFRDNVDNLNILSTVAECFIYSSTHQREFTSLLKTITDLLMQNSFEPLSEKLISTLSAWIDEAETNNFKGSILQTIENLFDNCTNKYFNNASFFMDGDHSIAKTRNSKQNKSTRNKEKKKSLGDSTDNSNFLDAFTACKVAMMKLKYLWKHCDCRPFLSKHEAYKDIQIIIDHIIETSNLFASYLKLSELPVSELEIVECIRDCGHVIQLILIWYTRDAYLRAEELKTSRSVTSSADQRDSEMQEISNSILTIRQKHVDMLTSWMSHESVEEDSESLMEVSESQRCLQREAFQLIGDLRLLFPLALADFHDVDELAFTVPQDVLSKMRFVFDYEGRMILSEITEATSSSKLDELSMKLIQGALRPLGTAMYFDPDHLNRRQASAVMMYYLMDPPSEKVMEFIKLFSKRFKDKDVVRYMEIQLVTLKGFYQDNIANILQRRIDRHNGKVDDQIPLNEENDHLQESLAKFQMLSKKLSSGLGVGKIKDEQSITALTNFIRACIDFSFTEDFNIVFLAGITNYVKFLPPTYLRDLSNHFQSQLRYRDMEEIESWPEELGIVLQSLNAFRSLLSGSSSGGKVVRVTGASSTSKKASRKRLSDTSEISRTKRPAGQLETVNEEDEGMDENEEAEDDDLELAAKVNAKSNSQPSKKGGSTAKIQKTVALPKVSNRPSRKATEKTKSYYEGFDDDVGYNDIRDDGEDRTAKLLRAPSSKSSEGDIPLGLALEDDDFDNRELSPIKKRGSSTGTIQSLPPPRSKAKPSTSSQKRILLNERNEDSNEEEQESDIEMDDDLDLILSVPIRQRLR